ncbi:MAG: hypothetical protein KDD40_12765, partial [Bdellovibrionales bacterium]|nr:hypothetical protein [Bdellovibrionales bacterium]
MSKSAYPCRVPKRSRNSILYGMSIAQILLNLVVEVLLMQNSRFNAVKLAIMCITFFASTLGLAKAELPRVLSKVTQIEGKYRLSDIQPFLTALQNNIFNELEEPISDVNKLNFQMDSPSIGQNSYDPKTETMYVSNMNCYEESQNIEYLAIAIHEFAHSLFSTNLRKHFRQEILMNDSLHDRRVRLILTEPENLEKAQNIQAPIDLIELPFQELFADTISVFILDDPEAISLPLNLCKKSQESQTRNFSLNHEIRGWNVGPLGGIWDKRHDLFSPVRSYLWRVRERSKRTIADSKIVRVLMDA